MLEVGNIETLSAQREELFINLYKKVFPPVARYVSKMGGSFDEARDVFQDALVVYYEKVVVGQVSPANEMAYLAGIAKNLWLKRYREGSLNMPLDNFDVSIEEDDQPSENRLMHFLSTAGKKCMDLLRGFYYDGLQLDEMATLFGFSGIRSATVQKYKCLEKVRETVKKESLTYEDFLD